MLVPLFSVYSRRSVGIGDLEDLKLLADWCEKTGNSIIQLLPMNEVGDNFCPYESVSSFALEPAYVHIEGMRLPRHTAPRNDSSKKRVDYRIKEVKIKILRKIYLEKRNRDQD